MSPDPCSTVKEWKPKEPESGQRWATRGRQEATAVGWGSARPMDGRSVSSELGRGSDRPRAHLPF